MYCPSATQQPPLSHIHASVLNYCACYNCTVCTSLLHYTTLHLFNGLFSPDNLGKPAPEKQNHSGKTNPDLLEQEIVSSSGTSWAICQSAPRPRHITTPAPPTQFFTDWMPFLPPNQQRQGTEGIMYVPVRICKYAVLMMHNDTKM